MSKNSHNKHEHKQHNEAKPANQDYDPITTPDFPQRHKTIIWILLIFLIIMLPLFFAAATLLHMFN